MVSSSLQQMFALTEVMQTNQTSASIGRFQVSGEALLPPAGHQPNKPSHSYCVYVCVCLQVDGSYDVNLLSLN